MEDDVFAVGDYVATVIEGPIVGRREEVGKPLAYKVRFSDAQGVTRERWLYGDELVWADDDVGACRAHHLQRRAAGAHQRKPRQPRLYVLQAQGRVPRLHAACALPDVPAFGARARGRLLMGLSALGEASFDR